MKDTMNMEIQKGIRFVPDAVIEILGVMMEMMLPMFHYDKFYQELHINN